MNLHPPSLPTYLQKAAICQRQEEWLFLPGTYFCFYSTPADQMWECWQVTSGTAGLSPPNCEIILLHLESNHGKNRKGLYCQRYRKEVNKCLIKQPLWSFQVQAGFLLGDGSKIPGIFWRTLDTEVAQLPVCTLVKQGHGVHITDTKMMHVQLRPSCVSRGPQ